MNFRNRGTLALAAALAAAVAACGPEPTGFEPTPISVEAQPAQMGLREAEPIHVDAGGYSWTLTPRARYTLRGVVLSRERYRFDWNSMISPCDVALAWGELAQDDRYEQASFSQSGRWYHWRYGADAHLDNNFIAKNSANVHIVPATENVGRAACSLRKDDLAELRGELIDVYGTKGERWYSWKTSLSRTDHGDGSCELLYVRRVKVNNQVYE